jgi:hypothetical protein
MRLLVLTALLFIGGSCSAQIKFDISKIKKTAVEKLVKEKSPTVFYLEVKYGGHELLNPEAAEKLENKIVKKVQYVYSDFPKDFDYTELDFQRFASLYVALPGVFNKPWIEWEIVKQTACNSTYEASTLFHGFVITCKDGPDPNTVVDIPADVKKQLENINSSVELIDIKSSADLTKFLAPKEMQFFDVKYTTKNNPVKLFKQHNPGGLPIINGLILTTGIPQGAIGPNNSPSVTGINNFGLTPDKNLLTLVGKNSFLFDAAVVEFDVQIDADSLVFKYAFASEEYPEYLQFNDVFGLFISGRGLNDMQKDTTLNLARLPDGKTPISVSSINHKSHTEYYIPNDYKTDLKLFKTWQYDGFTKVMTAKVKVKRGQTYHVKLAIADFGDPYYDSAIFIDAFGVKSK